MFWTPPSNTNNYENEIQIKIEALYADIKKLKLSGISARAMLDAGEAHVVMLRENIAFLRSDKAKIVSLSEIRSVKKQLLSSVKDVVLLTDAVNKIQADILTIEKEITKLEEQKKAVSLKIIPFRKRQ